MVKFGRTGLACRPDAIRHILEPMNRQRGTVKWFSRDKGWGFVRLEDGSEIFIHHSDIEGEGHKTLQDDEPVEFSVEHMEKGPRAREVRRLDGGAIHKPRDRASSGQQASDRAPSDRERQDPSTRETRPLPLAEQLRKRLSRLFPGMG